MLTKKTKRSSAMHISLWLSCISAFSKNCPKLRVFFMAVEYKKIVGNTAGQVEGRTDDERDRDDGDSKPTPAILLRA